ncbi:MAG: hypothetical protein WBW81_12950 [Methylocella sp.]
MSWLRPPIGARTRMAAGLFDANLSEEPGFGEKSKAIGVVDVMGRLPLMRLTRTWPQLPLPPCKSLTAVSRGATQLGRGREHAAFTKFLP